MNSAQMVSMLDELLDTSASASGTFYTTSHYYSELSAGQREVATILNKKGSNKVQSLLKDVAVTANYYVACPSDFVEFNAVKFAYDGTNYHRCDIYTYPEYLDAIENPYKTPTAYDPIAYIKGDTTLGRKIFCYPVHTTPTTSKILITYLASPTDIDGSTNSVLPAETHNAIVKFAFAKLLMRDKRVEESAKAMKEFYSLAEAL